MDRIRVAIVGAGHMAREHARALQATPNAEITGIFSRTSERAEALARDLGIPEVCHSVDELFDRTRAELVVVAVNVLAMSAVSRHCFARPWTILLEKPPGYDLTDAESILRAAEIANARRRTFVALNRRSYQSTSEAIRLLKRCAGPRFIVVQDQEDQQGARHSGQPEEVAANWMFANSIHVVDCLRVFGRGDVLDVSQIVSETYP